MPQAVLTGLTLFATAAATGVSMAESAEARGEAAKAAREQKEQAEKLVTEKKQYEEKEKRRNAAASAARGFGGSRAPKAGTILTSPLGLTTPVPTASKTLLGQ